MFKIPLFDKYIFKQVLKATLVCLLLFTIVWIAPEILVKVIRKIFINHIPVLQGLKILLYEMPNVLGKALPVGILLGTIFTFDKLSKDNELSILRGIGISFSRIMLSSIVLGFILSILCFFVGDRMIPHAEVASNIGKPFKTHFVYIKKDENKIPKEGIIVSDFNHNGIFNIVVIDFSNKVYGDAITFENIYFAKSAKVLSDRWILNDLTKYSIASSGVYKDISNLKNMEVLKGQDSQIVYELMKNSTRKDRTFTNKELKSYMKLLKNQEFTDEFRFNLCKYYQRFTHPLTCILFAILGCLLGFSPPRSQRLIGFTVAVGIVFAYYITLPFFDLLAQKGVLPPFLSAVIPIILFIGTIFAIKKYKDL